MTRPCASQFCRGPAEAGFWCERCARSPEELLAAVRGALEPIAGGRADLVMLRDLAEVAQIIGGLRTLSRPPVLSGASPRAVARDGWTRAIRLLLDDAAVEARASSRSRSRDEGAPARSRRELLVKLAAEGNRTLGAMHDAAGSAA